ncbi:uncharacterized protein COLE_05639 [Cutaneotrichosporon oleaginosum]|uniref:uncharacterized protein n=1 Tax=Cutaneotrichosporon oleaginosum TaxID=879819 RepID=UPI001320D97B|nr:hypothetical protein COLE_05639 [Cutaneotrichosporon oleaginosum]
MLPRPVVTHAGRTALENLLHREVSSRAIPATFFGAANADGEIFWSCAGEVEYGSSARGEVTDQTCLQMFSMTKLVTSVAALQLVDRGLASLDDPEVLHAHIPEISKQDILVAYDDNGPVYVPRRTPLTLRMLLSHTSGLAYARRNTLIQRWQEEHDCGKPGDGDNEVLGPLMFEPRTRWRYGTGVDWAGILLERISGDTLGAWMQANIFAPLGITSMTFEPGEEHEARLLTMCYRPSGGRPQGALPGDKEKRNMRARGRMNGGGGLYGTARDYLRFLSGVLASRDAAPGRGLLSRAMFDELFTSSLPPRGPDNKCYADCAKSMLFGTFTDPRHTDNDGQGLAHSVGFMLNTMDSVHGRRAFSGCWDGAAKSEYWIDPTTGVAAVCATNLNGPNPDHFMTVYNQFERTLYDSLTVHEVDVLKSQL